MADHLRPTAPIAPAAVLPGDPGRALALAQDLLVEPRMANHARGLWGYTASTPAGMALTVQSTGLGGPSVAIVLEELVALGLQRAIRLGTCQALAGDLEPGELVLATAVIPPGKESRVEPDAALTAAMLETEQPLRAVTVAGTDRYYDPEGEARRRVWRQSGAHVVDLGTAAALEVGRRLGVSVASALVVARSADGGALPDEEVESASLRLGRIASAALGGA